MASSAAQEEFDNLVAKNSTTHSTTHPEDRQARDLESNSDISEEEAYRNAKIDEAMRAPTASAELKLPPASFDSGRTTGVKGVIADARSYESARKLKWMDRARNARNSILGFAGAKANTITSNKSESETDDDKSDNPDEESFLQQWRESRRRELESEANRAIRNRKTSPSVRAYGRFDEVDAMGYLDAIEKVGRDTKVIVFVYDNEVSHHFCCPLAKSHANRYQCEVSAAVERAIRPLVTEYVNMHFVKVHYDDIEFDPAAVPAILAYKNQGDLFANLTGIIEMMPDDDSFDSDSLTRIFIQHGVL